MKTPFEKRGKEAKKAPSGDQPVVLDEMAATAINDMRNPLTGIQMGIDYLLTGLAENDPRWRGAALIRANVARIDRMIDDILFATETPAPILCPGRLWPLLADELARQADALSSKQARLELDTIETLPLLLLDSDQMRRALAAVIGRAMEALAPGGELQVSLRADGNRQVVSLAYRPAEAPPEGQKNGYNLDLGLFVARQIITAHQGQLRLWHQPEQGSGYTIILPIWPGEPALGQGEIAG